MKIGRPASDDFDRGAAVTRSLLGYGPLAGTFYLVFGLILALTRDGFDLTEHALSLLTLGDGGWLQSLNFILSGLMVIVASVGIGRATTGSRHGGRVAVLTGTFGASLVAAGIFLPDPVNGFPAGESGDTTLAGILHMVFGIIGFVSLAAAAILFASWLAERGDRALAGRSRALGVVILAGFFLGAGLSASSAGVLLFWVAVLAGWGWLAWASICLYRTVPHPDADRRLKGV